MDRDFAAGAAATLLSLALAARLRVAGPVKETSPGFSLGAADEAIEDPGDPLAAVESV